MNAMALYLNDLETIKRTFDEIRLRENNSNALDYISELKNFLNITY